MKKIRLEDIDMIKDRFENNISINQIAKEFNVSRMTIWRYINENQWKRKKRGFLNRLFGKLKWK